MDSFFNWNNQQLSIIFDVKRLLHRPIFVQCNKRVAIIYCLILYNEGVKEKKMSIGKKLKEARNKKNLTQEEVAQKLFVTRQTVSRWEQEKTVPNIYVLKELSMLYNISLDDLFIAEAEVVLSSSTEKKSEEKKEEKKIKKINIFALIGMIFFNICLSLAVFITALSLLGALWTITLTFITSPLMALSVPFVFKEPFQWQQLLMSLVLCAIGVILYPLAKKASHYLFKFFLNYVKFNMKAIYY